MLRTCDALMFSCRMQLESCQLLPDQPRVQNLCGTMFWFSRTNSPQLSVENREGGGGCV